LAGDGVGESGEGAWRRVEQDADGLVLDGDGAFEPPGERDDAVGEDGFQWRGGVEFVEELSAVEVEVGGVFSGDCGCPGEIAAHLTG